MTPAPCRLAPASAVVVTRHWRERVLERLGPGICPDRLAMALLRAIETGDRTRVEYLGRLRMDGIRAFRFAVTGGAPLRTFVALVQTDRNACITVLGPGHSVRVQSGHVFDCGLQVAPGRLLALPVGAGAT